MTCKDCKNNVSDLSRSRCDDCLEKARLYARANMDRIKDMTLRRRYGITLDEYWAMHEEQGGVCAICLKAETAYTGRYNGVNVLAVDHCHETGRVRGLLCNKCNTMLGKAEDDVEVLRRAADYLDFGIYS